MSARARVVFAILISIPASAAGASNGAAPTLPSKLAAYAPIVKVEGSARFGQKGQQLAARQRVADAKNTLLFSAAYSGAPAAVAAYSDPGLLNMFLLLEVRAPTPKPFVEYEDPAYLGLVRPLTELVQVGDVTCVVRNDPTVIGKTPTADSVHVSLCRRSDSHLTVEIESQGDGALQHQPGAVAALVEAAWQIAG